MASEVMKPCLETAFLAAWKEILGDESGFSQQDDMLCALANLEEQYGRQAGLGLALRLGRNTQRAGQRCLEELQDFRLLSFRVLPLTQKIKRGLSALAVMLDRLLPVKCAFSDQAQGYRIDLTDVPHAAVCAWVEGFIQETLYELSSGKTYPIKKAGDLPAFALIIEKKALD